QIVRPQSPPQPLEPVANETEKRQAMIDVREVDFTYGENKVLHNISLQMPPRAVTAFIGPSGCGKTTLLRCINRMNDLVDGSRISKGAIYISACGQNSPRESCDTLRRQGHQFAWIGRSRFATAGGNGFSKIEAISEIDVRKHRLRFARRRCQKTFTHRRSS